MRIKRMAGLGLAVGALVLSGTLAAAADSSDGSSDGDVGVTTATAEVTTAPGDKGPEHGERHLVVGGKELSDEQRECMEENGAAPPGTPGERPSREDFEAHRATVEAAMDECGIEHPEPGEYGEPGEPGGPGERGRVTHMMVNGEELSDEQRVCMEENAPKPPAAPSERPTREDFEQHRAAMEAAMDECGIDHPEPGEGGGRGFAFSTERVGPGGEVEGFGWAEAGAGASGYVTGEPEPANA